MYKISIEQHFDSAHFIRGYHGKCEALHGHRFRVVAMIKATRLDGIGLTYDFVELKQILRETLLRFDHVCLNDITPFDTINPSSENMAAAIYDELNLKLRGSTVSLIAVEVWESPQTGVSYSPD
ncbi:6-carboxytetrahydropterin synthase QueD [Chloroflexota bacterium]